MGTPSGTRGALLLGAVVGLLAIPSPAAPDVVDDEYWKVVEFDEKASRRRAAAR
jgi:hypothetical protein